MNNKDIAKSDLREAIYNYYLANLSEENMNIDVIHRTIINVSDSVSETFEDRLDDGIIDLSN
tara:strand:- start:13453 stop:13638 length:186 start_codon:yes stop_codon:yes gene_type:complete